MSRSQEALYALAGDSGGKALLNSNDLTLGIRQAQRDMGSYYMLGHYSANSAADGKYRRTAVHLPSHPEARLRYRDGYFAGRGLSRSGPIDATLEADEPVTNLPLAVEVDYFRVADGEFFTPITVTVPISFLGRWDKTEPCGLEYAIRVRDSSGAVVGRIRDSITVAPDRPGKSRQYVQYEAGFTLHPGSYNLVVLLRESRTGKAGTFETNFAVPAFAPDRSLRFSSVVFGAQDEPVPAATGSESIHPLVPQGRKLIPSVTRVFRSGQRLSVYFEVYDSAVDSKGAPSVGAELSLLTTDQKVLTSEILHPRLVRARCGVAAFQFDIPLSKLPPGEYTSQVSVVDRVGGQFAFMRYAIILMP